MQPIRSLEMRRGEYAQDAFWDLWNPEDAEAIATGTIAQHLRLERARRTQPTPNDDTGRSPGEFSEFDSHPTLNPRGTKPHAPRRTTHT